MALAERRAADRDRDPRGAPLLTRRIAGPDREPRLDISARDVVALVDELEDRGIDIWLDGGWGVDALLGGQTRPHDDLDVITPLHDVPKLQAALEQLGYSLVGGGPPMSFEMTDLDGRQIDVHPVVFNERGDGVYRNRDGTEWPYPARGFAGGGSVLGRRVRCLTPEVQVLCHAGYDLDADDVRDLEALRDRFGVELPEPLMSKAPPRTK